MRGCGCRIACHGVDSILTHVSLFVVMALDADYSLRRLERYLLLPGRAARRRLCC